MDDSDLTAFDEHVEDCADYFATVLSDDFPGITLEPISPKEWRLGWRIFVSPHAEYRVAEVEKAARDLRDSLWWNAQILVPFVIERPED